MFEHALYKNNISFSLSKSSEEDPIFRLGYQKSTRWRYTYFHNGEKENNGVGLLNHQYKDIRDAIIYGSENSSPEEFMSGYKNYFPNREKGLINKLKRKNVQYKELKAISPETFFIFVLRSPWNHISSGYFWRKPNHVINNSEYFSSMWINYSEEFLGITNHVPKNFVPVIYDRWFTDVEYRKEICDKIGVEFNDSQLNTVAHFGGGSTFRRGGSGQSLGVLNRWERCFTNEIAKKHLIDTLTLDEKMLMYSNTLFGPTPERIIEEIKKG
jgi:hypothetical protein